MHTIYSDLARFVPDDVHVANMRDDAAVHFKKCCTGDVFNFEKWGQSSIFWEYSYKPLTHMLSYGNVISEDEQRMLLSYGWKHSLFGLDLTEPILPDKPNFVTWMYSLEHLKEFSLFGEFMADKISSYLYSLCERLTDPGDQIPIYVNRYYAKMGQYSESWNKHEIKKKDLLLRIIRILNKCD